MAITFSKSISTTELLNTYNNNIVEFSSDSAFDSVSCNINIGGFDFVITPNNSNVFRFNFKEVIKAILDDEFEDTITPDDDIKSDTSMIGVQTVTYTITLTTGTDATSEIYTFFRSVEQINEASNRLKTEQQILNPLQLTAFKGYPFDITHYSDGDVTLITSKASKTLTEAFITTYRIYFLNQRNQFYNRVIADGGTYEDNVCWLEGYDYDILNDGFNTLYVQGTNQKTMTINLRPTCDGVYLKWFNRKGGYSYWLFNSIYQDSLRTRTSDTVNKDFDNLENTTTTNLKVSVDTEKERKLYFNHLTEVERLQINDLFSSPRVEMYNGTAGDIYSTWQTVNVKDGRFETIDTKRKISNVDLEIEINDYNF